MTLGAFRGASSFEALGYGVEGAWLEGHSAACVVALRYELIIQGGSTVEVRGRRGLRLGTGTQVADVDLELLLALLSLLVVATIVLELKLDDLHLLCRLGGEG